MEKFDLENKQVGWYRLAEHITDVNQNFATASWWEKSVVPPGIYPVFARRNPYQKDDVFLSVEFAGTVVDDFFPSSFGGVMYGDAKPKHIGESRPVRRHKTLVEGISASGISPSPTEDAICIMPEFWEEMAEHHASCLTKNLASFEHFKKEFLTQPETEHHTRVGMLAACGKWVSESATATVAIRKKAESYKKGVTKSYWAQNTDWVPSHLSPDDMRAGINAKSMMPPGYIAIDNAEKKECESILIDYENLLVSKNNGFASVGVSEASKCELRAKLVRVIRGDDEAIAALREEPTELKVAIAGLATNPKVADSLSADKDMFVRLAAAKNKEQMEPAELPGRVSSPATQQRGAKRI